MRTKHILALLVMLALSAPLRAGQHAHGTAGGAHHHASAPSSRSQQAPRHSFAPTQHFAPPPHVALQAPRPAPPPAQADVPHYPQRQITHGEGPRSGDWLRNAMRLPPQEQQRRLEQDQHFRQLPRQRQEQLRNRLQKFNSMPPQQQQRVLNRMEMMERMRPEQQRQAQALFGQFRGMDPQRKDAIRRTLREMRGMPPDARERMLNSPEINSRYSGQEIQMLRGFNGLGFAGPE